MRKYLGTIAPFAFWALLSVACGDDSSSNSSNTPESSSATPSSSAVADTPIVSNESKASPESSDTATDTDVESSSTTSANSGKTVTSNSSPKTSSSAKSSAAADTVWNEANLTWYTSWPDPGSEECIKYNGCTWAGYFAGLENQQTEEWVREHNIIAVHEKDWEKYKLKTFRLRQNGHTLDAVVYDMCSDSDCDGCCTENAGTIGFLIDIESYSCKRLNAVGDCDGVVEWVCLDCE